MPTVKRLKGYRFFFYAADRSEPPHIHIEKGGLVAKFWLNPVRFASGSFPPHELNFLRKLIEQHEEEFLEAWNEYFGSP